MIWLTRTICPKYAGRCLMSSIWFGKCAVVKIKKGKKLNVYIQYYRPFALRERLGKIFAKANAICETPTPIEILKNSSLTNMGFYETTIPSSSNVAGFLTSTGNRKMTHTIENNKNSLANLLVKVQDQASRNADYLAPLKDLQKTTTDTGKPQIVVEQSGGVPTQFFDINDVSFGQIASHAEIDTRTARRLQARYPAEFDGLLNAIWRDSDDVRMIRTRHAETAAPFTFGGVGINQPPRSQWNNAENPNGMVRAFVSDKFKTFDNVNLLEAALPQLMENPAAFQVVNADVTDKRLYLRLKSLVQTGTGAALNDLMANGIGLQNSEVGAGSVSVYQIAWTLACLNGMQTQNKTRSSHITSARDTDDWGLLSDQAKDADNHALELKIRDLVGVYSSRDAFDQVIEQMKQAAADTIDGFAIDKTAVVGGLGKVMQLTKKETSSVLDGLLDTIGQAGYEQGRPLSRATLINAVTAVSHKADIDDVDLWQQRGGQLLNMKPADWQRVAAIAA